MDESLIKRLFYEIGDENHTKNFMKDYLEDAKNTPIFVSWIFLIIWSCIIVWNLVDKYYFWAIFAFVLSLQDLYGIVYHEKYYDDDDNYD